MPALDQCLVFAGMLTLKVLITSITVFQLFIFKQENLKEK